MENKDLIKQIQSIKIDKVFLDLEAPFIPLKDKVVLKKISANFKTQSGLEVIELDKSNRPIGRIIALGPQCSGYLKKGLTVVYDASFWTPLLINGVDYIMCNEPFIDGIIADVEKVHIPVKAITGADIKRAVKVGENKRVRAIFKQESENATDKLHEDIKDRKKNPTKYK